MKRKMFRMHNNKRDESIAKYKAHAAAQKMFRMHNNKRDEYIAKYKAHAAAHGVAAPAAVGGVPYGHGTSVGPTTPPLSNAQAAAYDVQLAAISRPLGGAVGCAYVDYANGVQCQYNGMPMYTPSKASFHSHWADNVAGGWPLPQVATPGGLAQVMMGGGSGEPACAAACTCLGDPNCTCQNAPGQTCGYESVNQTCVEPMSNGQYASLTACEAANSRGNFR